MKSLDDLVGQSVFGPAGTLDPADHQDANVCIRMMAFVRSVRNAVGIITLNDGSRWECRDVEGFVKWVAVEGEE